MLAVPLIAFSITSFRESLVLWSRKLRSSIIALVVQHVTPIASSQENTHESTYLLRLNSGSSRGTVGVASSVQADMISGPFTTSTPIPYTLTDWTGSLSFPMFNSALGTLTEVDMTLNGRHANHPDGDKRLARFPHPVVQTRRCR